MWQRPALYQSYASILEIVQGANPDCGLFSVATGGSPVAPESFARRSFRQRTNDMSPRNGVYGSRLRRLRPI